MSEEKQVLADSQNAEAVNAVAIATEAAQKAHASQIEAALESAMTRFFSRGIDEKRFIDIGRIPFICDDIRGIRTILNDMSNDSKWMKRILNGAAGIVVIVFLPIVGWLLLQVIHNASAIAVLQHVTH